MKLDLMDHGPADSVGFCQKSAWMDGEMFGNHLKHFQNHVNARKENPVLLVLDGHSLHTSNLQALEYASQNGISMISLPPDGTHKMQPLDVEFMKPLRTYHDPAIERWLRANAGRRFAEYQASEAFAETYGKAATVSTAVNAFRKCGLWPINLDVFEEHEFAPSATTDIALWNADQINDDSEQLHISTISDRNE